MLQSLKFTVSNTVYYPKYSILPKILSRASEAGSQILEVYSEYITQNMVHLKIHTVRYHIIIPAVNGAGDLGTLFLW